MSPKSFWCLARLQKPNLSKRLSKFLCCRKTWAAWLCVKLMGIGWVQTSFCHRGVSTRPQWNVLQFAGFHKLGEAFTGFVILSTYSLWVFCPPLSVGSHVTWQVTRGLIDVSSNSSSATYELCDLKQLALHLWASVSSKTFLLFNNSFIIPTLYLSKWIQRSSEVYSYSHLSVSGKSRSLIQFCLILKSCSF